MPTLLPKLPKLLNRTAGRRHGNMGMTSSSLISATSYVLVTLLFCAILNHGEAHGQNLGRLFSSPAERATLDRLRLQNKLGEATTEITPPAVAVEIPPQEFTNNGFVKRSNGMETTWINQQSNTNQKHSPNIKVRQQLSKAPTVTVLLASGKRHELKVGQSFDVVTGKVREVYEAPPPRPLKKTDEKP